MRMRQRITQGQRDGNARAERKGCGLALGSLWRDLCRHCFGLGLGIHEEVPSLPLWSNDRGRHIAGPRIQHKCRSGAWGVEVKRFLEEEAPS